VINQFLVDVVETDEFGWSPKFEETRSFRFLGDAEKFVEDFNKKNTPGRRPGYTMVARPPREILPPTTRAPNIWTPK